VWDRPIFHSELAPCNSGFRTHASSTQSQHLPSLHSSDKDSSLQTVTELWLEGVMQLKSCCQQWEDQVLAGVVLTIKYLLCWKFWNCDIMFLLLQNSKLKTYSFHLNAKGWKIHFQKKENLRQAVWPGILAPEQKSGKIWNILIPSYLREKYLIWKLHIRYLLTQYALW